jgi:CRISPR-associated endonuclease/helicase Cas3
VRRTEANEIHCCGKNSSDNLFGMTWYAHSKLGESENCWQPLAEHLRNVASLAAEFAKPLGLEREAEMAGLLHDLGKYRGEFQAYLRQEREASAETQHAVYGAKWAGERNLLASAFGVAGHHAGLHDLGDLQQVLENPNRCFSEVLTEIKRRFEAELGPLPELPKLPPWAEKDELTAECYTRMLFSCVVDADRLDTASWPIKPPPDRALDAERLLALVRKSRDTKLASNPGSALAIPRNQIFDTCLAKAELNQGFFSLTVPTGGGKTLSAMALALAHAKRHGLRRIIVVIPYLSIIEQNAAEYRSILGDDVVLENHSAAEPRADASETEKSRLELAAENWNSPIVVTTSVQFLESLFASSPSRCRKLHRIPRSVVIFDEVQTLPAHLIQPTFSMFRELARNYGVSFVFSSATQPAFRKCPSLPDGFADGELHEIANNPSQLFRDLRRVNYHLPKENDALDWPQLAERLAGSQQVLCVVNLVRHAKELWEQLSKRLSEDAKPVHLSAAMYPQHRLELINYIRGCLRDGRPCRVIATQLIEAGVDVDFPVVWRALGPLDSIVQVAGRCNREARLPAGDMHVFRPLDHKLPPGVYRASADQAAITLASLGGNDAAEERLATDADLFGSYFNSLWQAVEVGRDIQEERSKLHFRTVGEKATVIPDSGQPVIVYHGASKEIVNAIRTRVVPAGQQRFTRDDLRRLQRFMVNVRTHKFQLLLARQNLKPLLPNLELYVLDEGFYHPHLGLVIDSRPLEDFIA